MRVIIVYDLPLKHLNLAFDLVIWYAVTGFAVIGSQSYDRAVEEGQTFIADKAEASPQSGCPPTDLLELDG